LIGFRIPFLLFQDNQTGSGAPIQSVLLFFAGVKRPEFGVDNSYSPIAEDIDLLAPEFFLIFLAHPVYKM
jgi:hypothetical protein